MRTAQLALAALALLAPALADHLPHIAADYRFEYAVHDPHTHDVKSQTETRHGDSVKGSYSLLEPSGKLRKVDYSSDKHTGFQAVVHGADGVTHHGFGGISADDGAYHHVADHHGADHQGAYHQGADHHGADYHAAPEYKFEYAVHDPHTHDVKSQGETRHGDAVKGFYSLVEPDGHVRKVEYSSDKHSGFQAVVQRAGKLTHHGFGEVSGAGVAHQAGAGHGHGHGHGGAHATVHGPGPVAYSIHF